jgi:integrase
MPGYVRARGKRADGSTKWQARWRNPLDQTERREKQFRKKGTAQRWITDMDSAAYDGSYVDPRKADRPVRELVGGWRSTWVDLEPKTRAGYESILGKHIIGTKEEPGRYYALKTSQVSTEVVQKHMNKLALTLAPNTVRRIYSVLRAVLRFAVERGHLSNNPCDAVKLPGKKRAGVRRSFLYLEGAELRTLAEAMPGHYRLPTYLAGSCGPRAGELWALRRRDMNLLHREFSIRYALKEINTSAESLADEKGLLVGPPKSAASRRTIALPGGIVPLLETHMADPGVRAPEGYAVAREVDEDHCELSWSDDPNDPDRLLFVTPSGYPVRHNLFYRRVFRPVIKGRAATQTHPKVPALWPQGHRLHSFRWHDLRHTCATLCLAESPNLHLVKERLGHENIQTTIDLYGKRVPSVDAALADAVGASIFTADQTDRVAQLHP